VTRELHSEPVITFYVVHMGCHVMEELGSMCDEGDCWISLTSEIDCGEYNIKVRAVLTH
jgi:hypothetical protein